MSQFSRIIKSRRDKYLDKISNCSLNKNINNYICDKCNTHVVTLNDVWYILKPKITFIVTNIVFASCCYVLYRTMIINNIIINPSFTVFIALTSFILGMITGIICLFDYGEIIRGLCESFSDHFGNIEIARKK
jgi:hypothetical protein